MSYAKSKIMQHSKFAFCRCGAPMAWCKGGQTAHARNSVCSFAVRRYVTVLYTRKPIFQINSPRQLINIIFILYTRYICQGDMFRPNRSSSGPSSRTQIQALFSFPALWDPINAYRLMLTGVKSKQVCKN